MPRTSALSVYSIRELYAGVDAFSITADEELGEYGEPVFHARLGQVPDHEGE